MSRENRQYLVCLLMGYKKSEKNMADNKWIVLVAIIGVVLFLTGYLKIPSTGTGTTDTGAITSTIECPSDGKTSVQLTTIDELASSATNANVSYYVFKSDGSFYKSGTTSAGTASFDVQCAKEYKLIAYADDGTAPDYYPTEVTFTSDGDDPSVKALNIALKKEGGSIISTVRDPVDLNTKIAVGAGVTSGVEVVFKSNISNAATKDIGIVVDVNSTEVQDVTANVGSGFAKITCPRRLTSNAGRTKYCFEKDGFITSADGTQVYGFSIKFSSTTTTTGDNATFTAIDRGMYQNPDWNVKGISAFLTDYENKNDNTNVGQTDSSIVNVEYTG